MWCQASLTSPVRPTRNTRRASVHVMRGMHIKAHIVTTSYYTSNTRTNNSNPNRPSPTPILGIISRPRYQPAYFGLMDNNEVLEAYNR